MLVPEAIARILKAEGVRYLFCYPLNPLIEAAAAVDIRPIVVRQERTGAHMADAFSRMSSGDEIGVFVMQHGPGAENTFGGVAQCHGESVPVLFMPAGYARHLAHYYPNFNSVLNMQHITKWAEPLTSGKEVANVMRRAFTQLRNGRPGPVLVEIPWDACSEEADISRYRPVFKTRTAPDPDLIKTAARELAAAAKPVIYAGQGIHYSKAWAELKALAELLNAPVTTSIAGKSAFDETHPLALGSGGHATSRMVYDFLYDADLIFGIGCSLAISSFATRMPPQGRYIHATLDPKDLNKDIQAEIGIAGDADLGLDVLVEVLGIQRGVNVAPLRWHARGEGTDRQTAADAEDQVGVVQEVVDHAAGGVTAGAQCQRMGFVEGALAGDRRGDGRVQQLGQRLQFGPGLAVMDALTGIDDRLGGGRELARCRLDQVRIGCRARLEHWPVAADVGLFAAGVPGYLHQHRTGAAIAQLREGAPHDVGDLLATGQGLGPLGDVLHVQHRIEVGVVVGKMARVARRHEQHRHRLAVALGHAAEGVLGARTMLHHEHADLVSAAHATESIGHVGAGTLLPHHDGADIHRGRRLDQWIERVAEQIADTFGFENAGYRLGD